MSLLSRSLRARQILVLIKQDIARALQGSHGQLFFIFFGIFWFWILWKFSGGVANSLSDQNSVEEVWLINLVFSWFFESDPKVLFSDHPATLSLYYLFAITTMPMFVLVAASNQTAGDIGSQYLRFLIPRCTRIEVFVARFVGATVIVSASYFVITLAAAVMSFMIDNNAPLIQVVTYTLQITLSILAYSLPFIAMMALCSACVGSAGLSALAGGSVYSIVAVIASFSSLRWPEVGELINYLLPSMTKSMLLSLNLADLVQACFVALAFVVLYGGAGWLVFSRRDI